MSVFGGQIAVLWARDGSRFSGVDPGWKVGRVGDLLIRWWPMIHTIRWWPTIDTSPPAKFSVVTIPLWIPLVVVAIPTGFLWRRERRRTPPGHCPHCRYNLTGNVSGVCPECGRKV